MKRWTMGVVFLFLAARAGALAVDAFSYADSAALQKAWIPAGASLPATASMGGDMVRAGRFPCNFTAVSDWRVYWNHPLKMDLSGVDQISITLRCPDPGAVSRVLLYFRSGKGWYAMPSVSVSTQWQTRVISLKQAAPEDKPVGWGQIDELRLGFSPAAKRDTYVEVAEISARSGWPLSYLGSVGDHADLAAAQKGLSALAKGKAVESEVARRLQDAALLLKQASSEKEGDKRQGIILQGRKLVGEAYALTQEPKNPEFRGVWIHHGDGPSGATDARSMRWSEAIPMLKAQGFNAIVPNVLWSGVAFYPSKVVPVFEGVRTEGDYLAEILRIAHPLGMKVHAWKVMWQFGENWIAPKGVSEPFRKAGRLQKDLNGKEQPWLCPSRPENRAFELRAITELVKNYDVDGIHLDYIRYGGVQVCYCDACRHAFEKATHKKVEDWPKDVAQGGPRYADYAQFKRDNITSLVREIRVRVKKIRPGIELSAAVFPYPSLARESVSQDWPAWVDQGLLDWVSTMTYTRDAAEFSAAVAAQSLICKGKTRLYPGLMVTFDNGETLPVETFVDQVRAVREQGLGGYMLFEWRKPFADNLAPYASAGLQRLEP